MKQSKGNPRNRFWPGALKLLIAGLAFFFIYRQLTGREDFQSIVSHYRLLVDEPGFTRQVIFLLVLMFVNWSLEAVKWRYMIRRLEAVPLSRALAAVFSGLTVSFFTPNRIMEYAGRVFHLNPGNRIKGALVTILENLSQLIVTLVAGSLSLIFYLREYADLHDYIQWTLGILMIIFSSAILFLFLEVPVLDRALLKTKKLKFLVKYLDVLSEYKKTELVAVLGLALLRYLVFTFQFYLLLQLFGVAGGYFYTMLLISMTFFVMTLIPSFAWTEIGVRGAVATYFFSKITPDTLAVLNATVSLWLVNLVLPALMGVFFVFWFRFTGEK